MIRAYFTSLVGALRRALGLGRCAPLGGCFRRTPVLRDYTKIWPDNWRPKHMSHIWTRPRNYPHRWSRQHSRRHTRKKNKTLKRYKFKRYKLAVLANQPHHRRIRVNLIPSLQPLAETGGTDNKNTPDIDSGVDGAESVEHIAKALKGVGKHKPHWWSKSRDQSKYTTKL